MDTANSSTHRFERKFVFEHIHPRVVEMWIKQNSALFRQAYPARFVNNVYFDSPGFQHYLENKDGVSNRTKIRLRWYGSRTGRLEGPVLELKKKQGLIGTKESHPLPAFVMEATLSLRELLAAVAAATLPASVRRQLAGVHPTLLNRYHRQYFASADGVFRLTLDSALEYYRVWRQGGCSQRPTSKPHLVVMEFKYNNESALDADRITNAFPGRVTRMSKYITGVEALYGG